jgi:H+/gluconate symporter-like permease
MVSVGYGLAMVIVIGLVFTVPVVIIVAWVLHYWKQFSKALNETKKPQEGPFIYTQGQKVPKPKRTKTGQ